MKHQIYVVSNKEIRLDFYLSSILLVRTDDRFRYIKIKKEKLPRSQMSQNVRWICDRWDLGKSCYLVTILYQHRWEKMSTIIPSRIFYSIFRLLSFLNHYECLQFMKLIYANSSKINFDIEKFSFDISLTHFSTQIRT